jgi:hypothetical protein
VESGALVFAALFLLSCSSGKPPLFPFHAENPVQIYGLSGNAVNGTLPLTKTGKLEYSFERPLEVPEDSSLEIEYTLVSDDKQGQVVFEAGGLYWELPRDCSFLGLESMPARMRYVVPVLPGHLDKITLSCTPSAETRSGRLEIKSMALVKRRFGFSFGNTGGENVYIEASPFVYVEGGRLVINPPEDFRLKGRAELKINAQGGSIAVEAGNPGDKGRFSIETPSPGGGFYVPGAFISGGAYPLNISGAASIGEALLGPAADRAFPSEPIPADPGLILAWPRDAWRGSRYEVFRWDAFPGVLIFDMADYAVQDRFLKRLAFFVEKAGFRGRLAKDEEIAGLHGWNAHDYRASSLASFFETARVQNFPLLSEEKELETILLDNGIIRRGAGGSIAAGEGAIVSISRESAGYQRNLFMAHEGFHGVYFVDEEFRDFSRRRWENLSPDAKRFIIAYFQFQAYDTGDADLVINEFMAHTLQQTAGQAANYFGANLPNRMIGTSPWRRSALPEEESVSSDGTPSWPVIAGAFTVEARAFSDYVSRRWGLAAGRVWKVTVE